jgi:hypothetical protein
LCPFRSLVAEGESIMRKLATLGQLLNIIAEPSFALSQLDDDETAHFLDMLRANLFRPVVEQSAAQLLHECFQPVRDRAWIHLEIIYFLLYKLHNMAPDHDFFDRDFVLRMFRRFNTPDITERQELIQFFKGFSAQHPTMADFLMARLCDLILLHVDSHERPFQVYTALPVLFAVIEGADPCAGFYTMIERVVFPLIRDPYLDYFDFFVVSILEYYAEDDEDRTATVVREIFRHFPRTHVPKTNILTIILTDFVPKLGTADMKHFLPMLLRVIGENVNSTSPKIAEVAFSFFLAPEFGDLMVQHSALMIAILAPGVARALAENWEESMRERAALCLAILQKFDPVMFTKIVERKADPKSVPRQKAAWQEVVGACGEVVDTETKLEEIERAFSDGVGECGSVGHSCCRPGVRETFNIPSIN